MTEAVRATSRGVSSSPGILVGATSVKPEGRPRGVILAGEKYHFMHIIVSVDYI